MRKLVILIIGIGLALNIARAQQVPGAKPTASSQPTSPALPARALKPGPAQPPPSPTAVPGMELLNEVPPVPLDVGERSVSFQLQPSRRVFGLRLQTDGVLPQLKRADNPLQLLNPFAPAHYGSGFDNLVIHPISGRPEGICLFALRF